MGRKTFPSDKSSYIYNQEKWLEKPREERERRVCEPLKDTAELLQHAKRDDDGDICEESKRSLKSSMKWFVVEFVTWTRPHENVNCKSSVSSNKGVYCYPIACIYEMTFSLRS